jgi:protein-serine/threonine kinase
MNVSLICRDLKPGNILLDKEGHIKVTDFGLSKSGLLEGAKTRGLCGTTAYVAPEVITCYCFVCRYSNFSFVLTFLY